MKCSIIIPCYNQAAYLPVAVNSALGQTYRNYEIVIVIDGSPDNSYEVATKLAENNSLIKVYRKENGGLSSARNFGIERATGHIILPLDADDKIAPTYLETAIPFFEATDKDLIVYCNLGYFGEKTGPVRLDDYSMHDLCIYNMIFATAFFRKSSWEKAGGYDINMKYGWEDWEFWLSLVQQGSDVIKIEEELFYYFIKRGSMLQAMTEEHKYYSYNYIWQKHKSFIAEHIRNPLILAYEHHNLRAELKSLQQSKAYKITQVVRKIKGIFYTR